MNSDNVQIRFERVTRSFGQKTALDKVSFEVPAGIVFALLGENGAGKTTSIKTMLGSCQPDSGQVSILGLDPVRDSCELRSQTGYVPEQASLYDWMTVKQAGWFAAGFYPAGYQEQYEKLVDTFGLDSRQKIENLSKGMRAKVVLALAMAHEPPLLILDEPTSGLDTLVRREFLESMVDLTAAGQTVFLSSHQIPEVERVADKVAIMKQGKLLLVEDLADLKDSCREVIVTFDSDPNASAIPGPIINHTVQGRQCICLIRTSDEAAYYRLQDREDVRTVDVRRPSLEDIFVGYMRAERPGSPFQADAAISEVTS